ncbi:MAG: hypothetical protein ACOY4R_27505 [Pseudomonadota bacterium]
MALKPHATTEEQRAEMGKIRRKPVQIDLLTGNLAPKRIKIARGDAHIRLKSDGMEPTVVPGMAHFAGTGPSGRYCKDCALRGDLPVWGRDFATPDKAGMAPDANPKRYEKGACRKAAELYDGHVQKGGLWAESACRYFEERQQ